MTHDKSKDISNVVLVTHMGCMDGAGSTIMFLRAGGKRENVRYVAAGMVEKFLKDNLESLYGKFILFADVAIGGKSNSQQYIDKLTLRGDCFLLDHHKTAEHLKGVKWCNINMNKCGTQLTREYFGLNDESSIALANLIQDHDLWLRKDKMSDQLAAFTVFVGQDIFVDRFYNRDVSKFVFDEFESELMKIVTHKRDLAIDAILKKVHTRKIMFSGNMVNVGYIITGEPNTSLLLDRLLLKYNNVDVACQVNIEKGSVSLRSKTYDVSEMASLFGGGGHAGASGHRISPHVIEEIIEEIHAR